MLWVEDCGVSLVRRCLRGVVVVGSVALSSSNSGGGIGGAGGLTADGHGVTATVRRGRPRLGRQFSSLLLDSSVGVGSAMTRRVLRMVACSGGVQFRALEAVRCVSGGRSSSVRELNGDV